MSFRGGMVYRGLIAYGLRRGGELRRIRILATDGPIAWEVVVGAGVGPPRFWAGRARLGVIDAINDLLNIGRLLFR